MLEGLFQIDTSFEKDNLQVRTISRRTADEWCKNYHYLKGAGSANWCYGIYNQNETMLSAIVITLPANHHGVAKKFGLEKIPGNMEITRVATHPEAPKNTTSQAIKLALKAFHAEMQHEWVFSYADTGKNHHGGIYQALNAVYLGKNKEASGFTVNGKVVHSRTIARHYGSTSNEAIIKLKQQGINIEKVANVKTPKHLYIIPIGTPSSRRKVREILDSYSLPYPKREQ